jgi:hypothetical protein
MFRLARYVALKGLLARNDRREHDPEKWVPVFPRDKREAFARRSCSNKKIERDDDSRKSHPALVKDPDDHGQYRYLADNQRCHFDRVVHASLNHLRPDDEVHCAVMRIRCKPKDTQLWARRRYFEFQI